MSVSVDHELMVLHLVNWLDRDELNLNPKLVATECSLCPEIKTAPPNINGRRPDLFSILKATDTCLIGEAKTTGDLDTDRTEKQLAMFVRHLKDVGNGYIVLGVTWNNIPIANSLLRKVVRMEGAMQIVPIAVDCSLSLMNSEIR